MRVKGAFQDLKKKKAENDGWRGNKEAGRTFMKYRGGKKKYVCVCDRRERKVEVEKKRRRGRKRQRRGRIEECELERERERQRKLKFTLLPTQDDGKRE